MYCRRFVHVVAVVARCQFVVVLNASEKTTEVMNELSLFAV